MVLIWMDGVDGCIVWMDGDAVDMDGDGVDVLCLVLWSRRPSHMRKCTKK